MIAVTLPFFTYLFQGSSGSKSKVDCIAISEVWTTGMLVGGEGPPDKRVGAPTSSKFIQVIRLTGNAELRTTPPNWGALAYYTAFLDSTSVLLGYI